jgi:hypothetical protein
VAALLEKHGLAFFTLSSGQPNTVNLDRITALVNNLEEAK